MHSGRHDPKQPQSTERLFRELSVNDTVNPFTKQSLFDLVGLRCQQLNFPQARWSGGVHASPSFGLEGACCLEPPSVN